MTQTLGFKGLEWRPNLIAADTEATIHLIENVGGGATDMLFHVADNEIDWFDLHVGQDDRLTFFGPPDRLLYASFIDCREGSETLHRRIDTAFRPDPRHHLHIERGIAYKIENKRHIAVRVENLWFVSADNPAYNLANDTINFRGDEAPDKLPVVQVNELPLPMDAMEYVLSQQQDALSKGALRDLAATASLGGKTQSIAIKRKG